MNSKNPTLSAILITYNEEGHILNAIDSVSFADEIIVLDSYSTDNTIELLQSIPGVKLFQNVFKDFPSQRNLAMEKASMDWILFLDADERIPSALNHEILKAIKHSKDNVGFEISRKFIIDGTTINFSGLQSDRVLRLFKRGQGSYDPSRKVHETLNVNGKIERLSNYMLHYTYRDYKSYKLKAEHYANLKALELYEKGKTASWIDINIKPLYKFIYNYVFRLGFLDGLAGYRLCSLNAYGVKCRFKKLKELHLFSPK